METPMIRPGERIRKDFGTVSKIIELPDLILLQKESYSKFLQGELPPEKRENIGLQAVFNSVFPIKDATGTCELRFISYSLERPKYDVKECKERGLTYGVPLRVLIQLIIGDIIKEKEVFFGEVPLMTEKGTFVINGTERVVVSQLHRSPGVIFTHDSGKSHASGKYLYSARIIPYRGSWLDFEFDHKDLIYVRIDKRRKIPVTVLLKALGYTTEELLDYFYNKEVIVIDGPGKYRKKLDFNLLKGQRAVRDIKIGDEIVVERKRKFTDRVIRKLKEAGLEYLPIEEEDLIGKVSAEDIIDEKTGEVLVECNEELTAKKLRRLCEAGIKEFKILFIDGLNVGSYLRDTLLIDKVNTKEEALLEIYRRLRPGDPASIETAELFFHNLFFNPDRYDLSKVGRMKINYKFKLDIPIDHTTLTPIDIMETVKYLISIKDGAGKIDDIDHLGNRRVKAVGEMVENYYKIGLARMERAVKEKMMTLAQEMETLSPSDLVNAKPVTAVVKEFFSSGQLSQFMDQTNPLSEITHKRRLSALGPGGLTRERAGFQVRDVHPSHYGRICPIETPEGQNIGLISSLAAYARVNEFGFIETPYRKVVDGKVTDEVKYYTALEEEGHYIAQANSPIDEDGRLIGPYVTARHNGEVVMVRPEEVTLMDISPTQLVSIASSLIPFLEHDDANRALMGSNMQRQAVPLIKTEAPLVGTGMEKVVARDSKVTVIAKRDGIVENVDASRIVVRVEGEEADVPADIYTLVKFERTNQNTCINQRPLVKIGDRVKKGQIIADGTSTENGELALGRNVLVAFMPWGGYNFEDAILISERLVKDDVYTSIHIEEYECLARDTKLGPEEITRDIPNVSEEALRNLDESGIIRIGAEVQTGDILVGKVTPQSERTLSPEEKLLKAIFGEKAGDVKDSSLRVPPGIRGIVINVRIFSSRRTEKDERTRELEDIERARLEKDMMEEIKIIRESTYNKIKKFLIGKVTTGKLIDEHGRILINKGKKITEELLDSIPRKYWKDIPIEEADTLEELIEKLKDQEHALELIYKEKMERINKGDELAPGILKMVKVYVAMKRKISVGDKMAGRHGNKGVISMILPEEDMPYLPDGTPVDIVLNPLGVPSRMNVGQILETHLGWALKTLGLQIQWMLDNAYPLHIIREHVKKIYDSESISKMIDEMDDESFISFCRSLKNGIHVRSPVFDGAKEKEIKQFLKLAAIPPSGQTVLFDGRTGEPFDQDVTVGIMYMLKLHHLVDDKIHARSTGPYSLVTQQPLGGKAQFGGQRLGEMEVWAMEAYGAAYSLQEFLTVKSDDVAGRTKMYDSIVKGEFKLEPGLPEAFNVLIKELQSLCINIELLGEVNIEELKKKMHQE